MADLKQGDIWKLSTDLDLIVIPTNIGWNRVGEAVMGAGLARLAAEEDSSLARWYGEQCKRGLEETPVVQRGRFILFPTKPLLAQSPWLSWRQEASLPLIKRGLKQLAKFNRQDERIKILVPILGCGERTGKLKPSEVKPLMEKLLTKSWFVIVEYGD